MKSRIKTMRLSLILLFVLGSIKLSAQSPDLVIQGVMNPPVLAVNATGQLTVDVYNSGNANVNANCAIVTISVPNAICDIISLNPVGTNPIWTIAVDNRPSAVTIRNTGGIIDFNFPGFYTIVLDIKATNLGGPSQINMQVQVGFPGCGNADSQPGNNFATTSLTVSLVTPVTLSAFDAAAAGCKTLVTWTSQQEDKNKEYQVEVSHDGRNYATIGTIQGAGNSNSPRSYSFTDNSPINGNNYYRLKMISIDGHVSYSYVVTVKSNCNGRSIKLYPNPVTEKQNLTVTIAGYSGNLKGEVLAVSGQVIRTFSLKNGTNTVALEAMAQGTYMLKVTDATDGKSESFKVVVIK